MSQIVTETYNVLNTGRKTVTSGGTAEALGSSTRIYRLTVQAETDNTNNVAVGDSSVVAAAGSERGAILSAGSSVDIYAADLADVYVDSVTDGEGVTFIYYTAA